MSTFLERLEEEEKQLSEKVTKLGDFVENNPSFENVSDIQSVLLKAQLNTMISYLHILQDRIEDLICNANN